MRVILPVQSREPLQLEQATKTVYSATPNRSRKLSNGLKVEKPDTRTAEAEQRERYPRSAERKAKKLATARARQQLAQHVASGYLGVWRNQPSMIGFLETMLAVLPNRTFMKRRQVS
jgi:hypothetical protein